MLLEMFYIWNLLLVAVILAIHFAMPSWLVARDARATVEISNAIILVAAPVFALAYEGLVGDAKATLGVEAVYFGTCAVVAYLTYRKTLFFSNIVVAGVVGAVTVGAAVMILQLHFSNDESLRYGVYFAVYAVMSGALAYVSRRKSAE